MRYVGSYLPNLGGSQVVNLPLDNGYTEVINDSNFAQVVTLSTGTCLIPPQMARLFPTPTGGGTLAINTVNPLTLLNNATDQYNNQDIGPINLVTINQYLENEIAGQSYPYPLIREVQVGRAYLQVFTPVVTAALSSGLTSTLSSGGNQPGSFLYLWGWDLNVDREGTAGHSVVVDVNGLQGGNTLEYYYRTSTSDTINASIRYPTPLASKDAATAIQVVVQPVASSTAKATLVAFGYYAQ